MTADQEVQPTPARAAGKLQDIGRVAQERPASTPTFADRLAGEWCANMTALVAELRALRRQGRRHD